ncbi:TPA: hypothetical protein ACRZZI_004955 [Vibrio harveyi]
MGGGGSDYEIRDTEAEKEMARIAADKWNLYNREFKPIENQWMQDIDTWNKEQAIQSAGGIANASTQKAYGEALKQQMSAGGNAGRLAANINSMSDQSAITRTDNINRMEVNQQNRYTQGLQSIAAMGQGKEAKAISGMNDAAGISANYAAQEAQKAYADKTANNQMIGAGIGAATRWGIS